MVVVIGYGNPLRQDDGAGWHVARAVEELSLGKPDLCVLARHQLTPDLAELLSEAERAVFIDASVEGGPGTVARRPVAPAANDLPFDTHRYGPSELLATARTLFGSYPGAHLITVTGRDFGFGDELSAPVRDALPQAAALAAQLCHAAEVE